MPTLSGDGSPADDRQALANPDDALLATAHGGVAPLSERFRRAKLRQQMFGDAGEELQVGRYRIVGKIGAGAMGTVYRAVDASLEREVALKVLHRRDATHRARMQIEAKALAKLSHPNVVTVHEVDTADDQLYVAMEYVAGKTLDRWLEDASAEDVLDVFVQAARGLHAAHEAGVVHRDFKPENVIVGNDGRVRVLDFGLAHSPGAVLTDEVEEIDLAADATEPAITRTGMLAGTPSYMAPEQFMGSRVDPRADQFAFCIVLHEAIWGARPFGGDNLSELAKSVGEGQSTLFSGQPRVPLAKDELDAAKRVIQRGLQTQADDRLDSMQEVVDRLRPTRAVAAKTNRTWNRYLPAAFGFALAAVGTTGFLRNRAATAQPAGPIAHAEIADELRHLAEAAQQHGGVPLAEAGNRGNPPSGRRCGLGTYEKNGACHPVVLDPSGVHCEEGGDCQLARKLLIARDGAAPLIATQGRLVPAIKDGESVGLKLFGVREHGVPAQLGFRVGDVIQRVNGLRVVGEREAIETLLTRDLDETPQLDINFLRGDEAKNVTVILVE